MNFSFYPLRFQFVAEDRLYFPAGHAGNILRGAFGLSFRAVDAVQYARKFEPSRTGPGPSGLADPPRPFVFRANHLDGSTIDPGSTFFFDLNLFDIQDPAVPVFMQAFAQMARTGIGPGRGRAVLEAVRMLDEGGGATPLTPDLPEPVTISLESGAEPVSSLRVEFLTPTELKAGGRIAERPDFGVLFGRIRDRIATLSALYGPGNLPIDYVGLAARAGAIELYEWELKTIGVERRSSRTGQSHGIGGFVGWADYKGDLAEFIPFFRAAEWSGIGRHCVWGMGKIRVGTNSNRAAGLRNL